MQTDFKFEHHGTICLVSASSDSAKALFKTFENSEGKTFYNSQLVVEHRYVEDFYYQLQEDGYTVSGLAYLDEQVA